MGLRNKSEKLLPMSHHANQVYEVEYSKLTRRGKARVVRHASFFSKNIGSKEIVAEGIWKAVYFEKNYYLKGDDVKVNPWEVPELFSVKTSELETPLEDVVLAFKMKYPWADRSLEDLREAVCQSLNKFSKGDHNLKKVLYDLVASVPESPRFPKGTLTKGQLSRIVTRLRKESSFAGVCSSISRLAYNARRRKEG